MVHWPKTRPPLLTRTVALIAGLLVLALTVVAACPELHERLHGHDLAAASAHHENSLPGNAQSADTDDGCVVTLFSHGLLFCLSLLALAFTGQVLRLHDFAPFARVVPDAPGYLHLPTQAPPFGLN